MSRATEWLSRPIPLLVGVSLLVATEFAALVRGAAVNLMMIGASRVVIGAQEGALPLTARASLWAGRSSAAGYPDDALVLAMLRARAACGRLHQKRFSSKRALAALQGRCLWTSGHREQAVEIWRRGGLGNDLMRLAAFDKAETRMQPALEEYEEALAVNPASVEAWLALGDLYERMGNWQRAEKVYDQEIRIAPDDPRPYGARAFLLLRHFGLANERTENAIETAIHMAKADPLRRGDGGLAWLYTHQALLYIRGGQPHLAEEAARKAIGRGPKIDYAHFFLGEALRLKGDPRGAIVELNRALELGSVNEGVRYSLAMAYLDIGETGKARTECERLRRISPRFPGLSSLTTRLEKSQTLH